MAETASLAGRRVSHYQVIEQIGAGGMGVVYRAHDERLDRDVALKVLPAGTLADESARKQFRREALALAKLNHPNIATIYDFDSQDGVDFLAMELIGGRPLNEKLRHGPLSERDVRSLGQQLAEGLAAAHEQNVIHRDLKPGNLFVTPDERLKILDFGLAKLRRPESDSEMTQSLETTAGGFSGTIPYMSPEQLRGQQPDPRSNIYAAGAVLYEMATGRRPFLQMQSAELMAAILQENPPSARTANRKLSPQLDSVIAKSLEKEPGRRYQTARELRVALEGQDGRRLEAPSRLRVYAAGGALGVLLFVGVGVVLKTRGRGGEGTDSGTAAGKHKSSSVRTTKTTTQRSIAMLKFRNTSGRPEEK